MNKKSRIKSTLDSLFTGGKISSEGETEKVEAPEKSEAPVETPKPPQTVDTITAPVKVEVVSKPLPEISKPVQAATQIEQPKPEKLDSPIVPIVDSKPKMEIQEKKQVEAENVRRIASEIDLAAYATDGDDEHLVIFTLGKELYGVTIHSVESIIKLQAITQVPRTATFILGVTNLRGTVVPVLDLRKRFNLPSCENTANTRIVIVNAEGAKVGIVVDEVTEVLKVSRGAIQPPPPMSTTIESSFINGIARINDRLVILLDLEKVLASSIRQHIR